MLCAFMFAGCSNGTGTTTPTATPEASAVAASYDVEDSADVIIVGGGGTGMSAALTAVENGAEKVIVVEKLANLGGFMRMKTGQFSAADTTLQREQGLTEDNAERYEEEIKKFANLNGGHPIDYLIHAYATHATEAWEWVYNINKKMV